MLFYHTLKSLVNTRLAKSDASRAKNPPRKPAGCPYRRMIGANGAVSGKICPEKTVFCFNFIIFFGFVKLRTGRRAVFMPKNNRFCLTKFFCSAIINQSNGELSEWSKVQHSKCCVPKRHLGFESLTLRHQKGTKKMYPAKRGCKKTA